MVFAQPSLAPLDSLSTVPEGVETRWFSPENLKGEKGVGGQKNAVEARLIVAHARGG